MHIRFNFALVVTLTLAFALVGSFLFIGHSVRADFDVADSSHLGLVKAYAPQARPPDGRRFR